VQSSTPSAPAPSLPSYSAASSETKDIVEGF